MTDLMHDPAHTLMGVDKDGNGPVDHREPNFHHWQCWCGPDTGIVVKFNGGLGDTLCARTYRVIYSGFPPGWLDGFGRNSE